MSYKTVEGVLHPDGKVTLTHDALPDRPMRAMVTLLEEADEAFLSELGDYLEQLEDYEERLARGDIRWQ